MPTVLPSHPPLKAFEDLSKKLIPFLYPSPLIRYTQLEKTLDTPFKIWLKCENHKTLAALSSALPLEPSTISVKKRKKEELPPALLEILAMLLPIFVNVSISPATLFSPLTALI